MKDYHDLLNEALGPNVSTDYDIWNGRPSENTEYHLSPTDHVVMVTNSVMRRDCFPRRRGHWLVDTNQAGRLDAVRLDDW